MIGIFACQHRCICMCNRGQVIHKWIEKSEIGSCRQIESSQLVSYITIHLSCKLKFCYTFDSQTHYYTWHTPAHKYQVGPPTVTKF